MPSVTFDVAAASTALEARILEQLTTKVHNEIAESIANAGGNVHKQLNSFISLLRGYCPTEDPKRFFQNFSRVIPEVVSGAWGASESSATSHNLHQQQQHAAFATTTYLSAPSYIETTEGLCVPGLFVINGGFAITTYNSQASEIDEQHVPPFGRIFPSVFDYCKEDRNGRRISKPIGQEKSVNYFIDLRPDWPLNFCFVQMKRIRATRACILWPQPYARVDTSDEIVLKEFRDVDFFLGWLHSLQEYPRTSNIRESYLRFKALNNESHVNYY